MSVSFVINEQWLSGLASSLQAGAAALSEQQGLVLILVCDQLRLTLAHLQALLAVAAKAPDRLIVSGYGGSVGIPVLVSQAFLRTALAQSSDGERDRGLKPLLQSGSWPLQTVVADELIFDLDTPADLRQAIANGWLDPVGAAVEMLPPHA